MSFLSFLGGKNLRVYLYFGDGVFKAPSMSLFHSSDIFSSSPLHCLPSPFSCTSSIFPFLFPAKRLSSASLTRCGGRDVRTLIRKAERVGKITKQFKGERRSGKKGNRPLQCSTVGRRTKEENKYPNILYPVSCILDTVYLSKKTPPVLYAQIRSTLPRDLVYPPCYV